MNLIQQKLTSLIQIIYFQFIELRIDDCNIKFHRNVHGKTNIIFNFNILEMTNFIINSHDLKHAI